MANRQTNQVELLDNPVNNIRSNIVHHLSTLYKTISLVGTNKEYSFENYKLTFQSGVMSLIGCIDEIKVTGNRYSDVRLGSNIKSYGHVPIEWIIKMSV